MRTTATTSATSSATNAKMNPYARSASRTILRRCAAGFARAFASSFRTRASHCNSSTAPSLAQVPGEQAFALGVDFAAHVQRKRRERLDDEPLFLHAPRTGDEAVDGERVL